MLGFWRVPVILDSTEDGTQLRPQRDISQSSQRCLIIPCAFLSSSWTQKNRRSRCNCVADWLRQRKSALCIILEILERNTYLPDFSKHCLFFSLAFAKGERGSGFTLLLVTCGNGIKAVKVLETTKAHLHGLRSPSPVKSHWMYMPGSGERAGKGWKPP